MDVDGRVSRGDNGDESMKGIRKDFPNDIRDITCKLLRSEDVFPY